MNGMNVDCAAGGTTRSQGVGDGTPDGKRARRRLNTLILFDIDGTLVLTGGAGGRAMRRAFTELFQITRFQSLSMAGRTDRWIVSELAARHGVQLDDDAMTKVLDLYLKHLSQEMHVSGPGKRVLPGVEPLLGAMDSREDVHLALLTGNVEAGARIKLDYFDLWRYFAGGGYGDAAVDRTALFAHALDSAALHAGAAYQPAQVIIIGDTPFDIEVARASGARSLGVATGNYDEEALRQAGADAVLHDLSDLGAVMDAVGLAEPD